MEKAPESIASGKRAAGEVYLRKDVLTTLVPGYVYNPFPVALTPEHCFVAECLLVFDADDTFALCNAEGDFEISGSNTRTEVIAKLEAAGIPYEEGASDAIALFPYGSEDGRSIRLQVNGNRVYTARFTALTAFEAYTEKEQ